MNRWLRNSAVLLLGVGFGLLPGGQAALAAPSSVCTVNDTRLPTITGLVSTNDGYAVITNPDDSVQQVQIFLLDSKCAVTNTVTSDFDPRDIEDLTRTSDGTYWVADTGDADASRATVAVHEFSSAGTKTIQRMRYPDGKKDAQALLVQNTNVPVIITKAAGGTAKVYKASKAITGPSKSAEQAVPLVLVGTVALGANEVVTGAAQAPDGKRVALRTNTSIFEFDVTGGDMAKALTSVKPRQTKLTGQQGTAGGAVAYSSDGKSFLTLATGSVANPASVLQKWPAAGAATSTKSTSGATTTGSGSGGSWLSKISFGQITTLVGVVGLVGLALLISGIVGIVRFRRRSADEVAPTSPGAGPRASSSSPDRRGGGPGFTVDPPLPPPVDETMHLPRVAGAVYGGRPEPVRGGAAVVPPSPRGAARDGRPGGSVGAGVNGAGVYSSRADAGFRSEGAGDRGPVDRGVGDRGPGDRPGPVSGSARPGGGTVYGGGAGGGMPPDEPASTSGRIRRPQGPAGRSSGIDPTTTGGGRVRPPRPGDGPRGDGPRGDGSRGEISRGDVVRGREGRPTGAVGRGTGSVPPPPPVDRGAPTRTRRAGPPPLPPGTYGGGRDRDPEPRDGRGPGRDSRDGWEPERDASGARPRPQGERMRPPPPPGARGRREPGGREDDGRPPAPPGRRPPAPPDWDRDRD